VRKALLKYLFYYSRLRENKIEDFYRWRGLLRPARLTRIGISLFISNTTGWPVDDRMRRLETVRSNVNRPAGGVRNEKASAYTSKLGRPKRKP
jgi:hypothetical protein